METSSDAQVLRGEGVITGSADGHGDFRRFDEVAAMGQVRKSALWFLNQRRDSKETGSLITLNRVD